MSEEIIQRVTGLVQSFDARVQATDKASWTNSSPCADWTARDIVVHVAGNLGGLGGALTGTEPTAISADDDIIEVWNTTRDQFLAGVTTGDLSQSVPGPFGPMPAEQLIGRLVCTDVLVHTWDLARAVGGDERLDHDAVEGAFSGLKPMDAMIRQPGFFDAKVDPPEGADLQAEFLSFLGRRV